MKKRSFTKLLSCVLAFSMVATAAPVTAMTAELPVAAETKEARNNEWTQDPGTVKGTGSLCEMSDDGVLHIKSGTGNRQGTTYDSSDCLAAFWDSSTYDFTQDGYFEFKITPKSDASDGHRFGVIVDYRDPGTGLVLGFDGDGWYWEKFFGTAAGNVWTPSDVERIERPAIDEEQSVRIDWTADGKFSLTVDGETAYQDVVWATDSYTPEHSSEGKIALTLGRNSIDDEIRDIQSINDEMRELEDGVNDAWYQDEATILGTGSVNELTADGWRHFKGGSGNGNAANNASSYPAAFVHPKTFDFTKAGYFEFDLNQVSSKDESRFGVFLDYKDPGNGMFLGYDKGGWFWQKYTNGDGDYYSGGRVAAPTTNTPVHIRIDWTADGKFSLTVGDTKAFTDEPSGLTHSAEGKIALKCSTFNSEATEVKLQNIHYTGQGSVAVQTWNVTGKIVDAAGNALEGVNITVGSQKTTTGADGVYTVKVKDGDYTVTASKNGYLVNSKDVTVEGGDVSVPDITLAEKPPIATEELKTEDMTVSVAKAFPYIIQYDLDGKVFYGQTAEINTIKINGTAIAVDPDDITTTFTDKKATYVMHLTATNIDCEITAEISVDKNTASFDITNVTNNLTEQDDKGFALYPVQTIEIPNHSLISVRSSQDNAHLKGAIMSSETTTSGDSDYDVTQDLTLDRDFIYAFINNSEMSAGLWSNSENEGSHGPVSVAAGGASNTRVLAQTQKADDGSTSLGLSSAMWYYDRKITTKVYTDVTNNVFENRSYVVEHEIMPSAKVVITGDENGDGDIDWQDGAVAFRSIMHNPFRSEVVPELVNYRIAMNFGSQAANPFLMNLDGVKRVYLNTDGLGQGVLLKGYGSEGHDSGHPDYGDIGRRIGGADDMNTLMTEGRKMGALFGIHVNASEMYTEAKAFSDELSGGYSGLDLGWNWLDQGIGINSFYDLGTGNREKRFKELFDQVGTNLEFIYVDVWGNNVASSLTYAEDSWASRMLAREITGLGWRLATEWGPTQEYDSTLQHWAADLAYGGAGAKGENSVVMRFLRNHQKDSWVADYPKYNGAAQMPLLGGLNMTDFEGWQGRTDFRNYITVMFRHNLITKYLQHYQVVDWVDGTPAAGWTPEMQITLRNTQDADDDTEIVVSRDSNDISNLSAYRSRTIKVNDVTVSTGAPTGGDGSNPGNEKYLIPWNWDLNGEDLDAADQKMYHWNTQGGESTWTLTKDWSGLSSVVVYKLTDEGKTEKKEVPVVDNQITLTAEAEIPYVVYKGEKANLTVDWQSTKYVYDTGFNDPDINSHRTITGSGTAEIVDNRSANNMLKLEGEVAVSTTLTNLKPGQKYALYVGVDNRSDANAYVNVTNANGSKTLGTNYTGRSFVENIVSSDQHHTGSGSTLPNEQVSYFQNMYVFFTAEGTTATLTMKRDAGEGATYFDDIRVVETKMDVIREQDADGNITALYNDFEENAQGIWPFVISGPKDESGTYAPRNFVTDNRIHLSERHDKYTQAGFMSKKVDDVLDGNWSVKINGLTQNNSMIYQTIPQNFRFVPGEKYNVTFDYQMGDDATYEIRLGDGQDINVKSWRLTSAVGKTKTYSLSFTASESGNSWIGVYSTGKAADTHNMTGKSVDFSGYKDFILDNLKIEKASMEISPTFTEVETAEHPIPLTISGISEDTKVTWTTSDKNVARVSNDGKVYFVGFGSAMITATAVVNGKTETLSSSVYYPDQYVEPATLEQAWANTQETTSESGGVDNVIDGSANSIWHSNYSTGFTVSETNPAIVTVRSKEDISEFERIAFQQRGSGGSNGIIQKYECIVGSSFDANTHTVGGTTYTTGVVSVTGDDAKNSQIVEMDLPEGTKGNYLQIRVLQGYGGFAAMSEVIIDTVISYDTPEERAFMQANKGLVVQDELDNAVGTADQFGEGKDYYTEQSWLAFQEAYEAAKAGADDPDAIDALVEALNNLNKLLAVQDQVQETLTQTENTQTGGQKYYTAASWEAFSTAYAAAQAGLPESLESSEWEALNQALASAQELLNAQDELNQAFTAAKPVYDAGSAGYTSESWALFEEAYQDAETARAADSNLTDVSEWKRLASILKATQANLEKGEDPGPDPQLEAARNALKSALAAAKAIYDGGQKNYTKATWDVFKAAYESAQAGVNSNVLTELQNLKDSLMDAQSKLATEGGQPVPEDPQLTAARTGLQNALTAADAIYNGGQKNYTDESWNAFKSAYEAAKAGINSANITELNNLAAALSNAQSALAEKAGQTPVPTETFKKGQTFTIKKIRYKVTSVAKKTVTVVKGSNQKTVSIPATVSKGGVKWSVTAIDKKAFKNYKKLQNLTIGKNVKTIGKQSFYGCSKLKKVIFTRTSATSIKSKAFTKTNSKMKVQLPKKMSKKTKSTMKSRLKKAGVSKKATIK